MRESEFDSFCCLFQELGIFMILFIFNFFSEFNSQIERKYESSSSFKRGIYSLFLFSPHVM